MARLPGLVVVLVLAVGCGSVEQTGPGAPSTERAETLGSPSVKSEEPAGPPHIVLTSTSGRQEAVAGSFCVDDPARGVGTCGDSGPVHPSQLTVAPPGNELSIALEGAVVVQAEGCHSDAGRSACIGTVTIRPLGCGRTAAVLPLRRGPETRFRVDLPPGAYELDVFAYFEANDGRSGDVSGTLGIVVDETRAPGIVPASSDLAVCRQG